MADQGFIHYSDISVRLFLLITSVIMVLPGCFRDFDRGLIDDSTGGPIVSVATSGSSSCVVHQDGRKWCWGSAQGGQLGTEFDGTSTPVPQLSPFSDWRIVAHTLDSSIPHACGITNGGQLFCWGPNNGGALGRGSRLEFTGGPIPERVGEDSDWVSVGVGVSSMCAIRTEGSLWCMGWSEGGRLGGAPAVNSHAETLAQARVPSSASMRVVDVGFNHSCAIDTDGQLWCWGHNEFGKRGFEGSSTPPQRVAEGQEFRSVSAGFEHTCAVRADSTLWCWGKRVGDPAEESGVELYSIESPSTWSQVSAGLDFTCGISQGALYCWGENPSGNLGFLGEASETPVRVGERDDWLLVSVGERHGCGATSEGRVLCWGSSSSGATGGTNTSNGPVEVTGF